MSSYLKSFLTRLLNLLRSGKNGKNDGPPALRRCNSMIEVSHFKEAQINHTSDHATWLDVSDQRKGSDETLFFTPFARNKENFRGGAIDSRTVVISRDFRRRSRSVTRDVGAGDGRRRSRSCGFWRETEWHRTFYGLRRHANIYDDVFDSKTYLVSEEMWTQKSFHSEVDAVISHVQKNHRSKIPIPRRFVRKETCAVDDLEFRGRRYNPLLPPVTLRRQRAAPNMAHRCRILANFEDVFRQYCGQRYKGNIIELKMHCKWMRDAHAYLDEDGKRFKKYARAKVTLNISEYKCFIKKMCDETGLDYWDVLRQLAQTKDTDASSTKSAIAFSVSSE